MRDQVHDLVVIIPGILGSRLERHGKAIWGTAPSFAHALADPQGQLGLRRTGGHSPEPGVEATGLIGHPAQYPGLVKVDLYGPLLDKLHKLLVLDDDNLVVFPYDWRLANATNATLLAQRVMPLLKQRRRLYPDAKLVLVCHSMGGVLAQHFTDILDGGTHGHDTRSVITFGTPFRGAAKALGVLAHGWPPNLPGVRSRFRDLARSLPSVHELLPRYRAITSPDGLRHVTPWDLAGITDPDHLDAATAAHTARDTPGQRPYRRRVIAGTHQPTHQFVTLTSDSAELHKHWHPPGQGLHDRRGDGTVPRQSVTPPEWDDELDVIPDANTHIALPTTHDAARHIHAILTSRNRTTQAPEPRAHLTLDAPDITQAGTPLVVHAAADNDIPIRVHIDHSDGEPAKPPRTPTDTNDQPTVTFTNLAPGTYRIRVEPAIRAPDITPVWDLTTILDPTTPA